MKKLLLFSCVLVLASVAFAQQNILPQNLFILTPQERILFTPHPVYLPIGNNWTGYEGPSLKGFWEAFDKDSLPIPLNPSQNPGGWYSLTGTGSQNHSLLWIGESALGHALAGNVNQYEIAAKNAITLLDSLDYVQGHMRHEAFGLYIGFWEGGIAAMALAGLYAPAGSTSGPALLKSARRWWNDHIALLRRVRLPDGQIARLGARMNHGQPGEDDIENLSAALNLQLIDPQPYNTLHPSIQTRITADGKPQKLQSSGNPIAWNEPRGVAERWMVLRAFHAGAILRVPADHPAPFVIDDVYKWTSGNKTYFATPSVTGYPNCRWKVSWQAGQFVNIVVGDTGNTNGGKGPHTPPAWQPPLSIPVSTPKILGPVLSTPNPACAASSNCTNDAAVMSIVKPYHNGCLTTINPQVVIKNEGTNGITELALYYQIDNNTLYSEYSKGAIKSKRFTAPAPGLLPDSTITLTLDVSTVTPGAHILKVWVMDVNKVADINATNDLQMITFDVVNSGTSAMPYTEDFESTTPGTIPFDWTLYNADANAEWFVYFTGSNKAIAFNNFAYTGAQNKRDEVVTPVVDLTGNSSIYLSFDLCHASKPAPTIYDSLEVLISTDCGNTFTSIWGKGGTALNTVADNPNLFIPVNMADYQNVQIDLSAYNTTNKAIFKFINWSNNGNSTLIDNVYFTNSSATAVDENNANASLNIFPNPSNGIFTVIAGKTKQSQIEVYNSFGEKIYAEPVSVSQQIDFSNQPDGIYTIILVSEERQIVARVVLVR